jgi:hypothetical protein
VLATHTTTLEDCYFCVWEGFGDADVAADDDDAVYIHEENTAAPLERPGGEPGLAPTPAARIGGTPALITQLTTDPRLDVVPADPTQDQPLYFS